MPLGLGLFEFVALALWIYCIFDVIRTEASVIENLPKMLWLLLVVFLGPIGSIAWLLLGRPRGATFRIDLPTRSSQSSSHPSVRQQPPVAPPTISPEEYQRRREEAIRRHEAERAQREEDLKLREEEVRRREEELRRREQGLGEAPPSET